ncbi:hypothetical protein Dcar01_03674 [Deinococcus carri]|uniref:Excalibur calcium-binding domain-containing protein n=1 Tax=Deinococcus carri TaxID=1211323 RepID=A0ABP9WEK7_9DEIO
MKKLLTLTVLTLASTGVAATSSTGKPCGNSYIPQNSTCHVGTPATPPTAPRQAVWFASCQAARAAGRYDIPRSDGAYSAHLDRDHDGLACESNGDDNDNYNFNPYNTGPRDPNATQSTGSAPAVQVNYGAASPVSPDPAAMKLYRVVQVLDGSHLVLNADYTDFPAELIGVQVPKGQEVAATAWLTKALPVNTLVYVEQDKAAYAPSRAMWVYIWQDQQLVNAQLVLAGLATAVEGGPNTKYLSYFQAAQASAKATGLGVWQP